MDDHSMQRTRHAAWVILLAFPMLLSADPPTGDTRPSGLPSAVQRQQDVRDAVARIQQQLAMLVRFEQDPDIKQRAAAAHRLLQEQAVAGGMGDIATLLRRERFDEALQRQKETIDTLGRLLELLARKRPTDKPDDDHWRMELDIAEKIDELIHRQTGLVRDAADTHGTHDPAKAAKLRDEQLDTQGKTEDVGKQLDQAADADGAPEAFAEAGEKVAAAAGKMEAAAGQLGKSGKPGAAGETMKEALADLEDAAEILRDDAEGRRKQERLEQIFALQALLRRMLTAQQDLSRRTRLVAGRELTRLERLEFGRLAKGERKLTISADEALKVLGEEGTALVFPEAIKEVRGDLTTAADLLARHDGGEITRGIQTDVERALLAMLDALAAAADQEPTDPTDGDGPPPDDPPIVSFLAELKLLRGMQDRCNRRTDRLAKAVPPAVGRPVSLIYLKQLSRTGDIQGGIGRLAQRLAEQLGQ